jgi:hypothetical protein
LNAALRISVRVTKLAGFWGASITAKDPFAEAALQEGTL